MVPCFGKPYRQGILCLPRCGNVRRPSSSEKRKINIIDFLTVWELFCNFYVQHITEVYREGRRMSSIPVNKLLNNSWRRLRPELGLKYHVAKSREFWVSMYTTNQKEIKKKNR